MRIGLVGYGVGGRYFHAPFIQAAEGCDLTGIVARSPQRVAELHQDLPGVPVFASLGELLDAGVDAVTISTPPQTRRELVLEAVGRGVNVIADKPFAPTAAAGQALVDAAAAAGVLLSVFHNRRWDTDITTLRGVLDEGLLGEVWRFDSRFDLDEPQTLEGRPRRRTTSRPGQSSRRPSVVASRTGATGVGEPRLGGAARRAHRRRLRHHALARQRGTLPHLVEQGEPTRVTRIAGAWLARPKFPLV
jgi:predicted dehydrogenase